MAYDALFSRVVVPAGNIHAIPTEGLSPEQAAFGVDVVPPDLDAEQRGLAAAGEAAA